MTQCQREYGDISRFHLGPYNMYQVTDPAMIEQVLVDHDEDWPPVPTLNLLGTVILEKELISHQSEHPEA
jgi:cytochrome P450